LSVAVEPLPKVIDPVPTLPPAANRAVS